MSLSEKISLFFSEKEHKIGELIVDAFLSEIHELRTEATEHPLENGSSFVDHIYNLPISIQLEGIISNAPMSLIGLTAYRSFMNFKEGESNNLLETAFKKLENIFAQRQPISIQTSVKIYKDMVLESLSIERGGGDFLKFRCTAKQIRITNQQRIEIPAPKVNRAQKKKNLGKQPAKELPKVEVEKIKKETSFLKSLFR